MSALEFDHWILFYEAEAAARDHLQRKAEREARVSAHRPAARRR